MNVREAKDSVDHLVLGVSDLQSGIEWVEKKTGVRAVVGGRHPNRGTQNALLALEGRKYLEIMAPDPQQAGHEGASVLQRFTLPRLVLWAASTTDINALAQQAKKIGLTIAGPLDGARSRPDGTVINWRTLHIAANGESANAFFNPMPFFIQWEEGSAHPSGDSPVGCRLLSLEFLHCRAVEILDLMRALGIQSRIGTGAIPTIKATLETPKGKVELI